MKTNRLFFAFATLVPLAAPAAQAPQSNEVALMNAIKKVQGEVSASREALIKPVTVNGKVLSPEFIKREVVYLTGSQLLTLKTLEFIVEEWKKRFIEDKSRKPGEFKVDEAKIERDIQDTLKDFRKQYPKLDIKEVFRAQNGLSWEQVIHQRRVVEAFDMVFMHGTPDKWPMVTREAIKAGSAGGDADSFFEGLVKQARDDKGKPREMPAMWKGMIRQMVIRQLQSWSEVKYAVDGIPANVVMDCNGFKWSTKDAFNMIKENVFLQDLERAYTEVILREALRQELEKRDCIPTQKEFRDAYSAHEKEFEGSLFSLQMIATAFKGYPTIEAYRQRWRLMLGYEKLIAKDINDENLEKHLQEHNRFFGDGSVNCDVISFLAKDPKSGAWRNDGMQQAKKRAAAALAMIKGGKSFDDVLDAQGEYFHQDKERGRLGSRSLNDLRRQLRESEYTDLVTGCSLGYHLYYKAEVGKVLGPVKGPDAYYLVRINSRSPERTDIRLDGNRTRDLVKQDYIAHRFMMWANEVIARAKIQ